jgi:hypothetical protein
MKLHVNKGKKLNLKIRACNQLYYNLNYFFKDKYKINKIIRLIQRS